MSEPETLAHSRRGAGRAAKRAHRMAATAASVPYITRKIPIYEVLNEEGLALIEHNADTVLEEIGIDFRGDEEALQLWRDAGADVQGERVRFPRGLCREHHPEDARPRTYTQHARNPARSVRDRRRRHGVRAELRLAVRARPRRRPALRHDRGFPQFREARLHFARSCTIPAARCASRSTCRSTSATRHGLRAHALQRQAVHGLGHASRPRAPIRWRWRRSCSATITRSRTGRPKHGHDQPDQRQLAAGVGRHHAGRAEGLCARPTRPA